MKLMPEIGTLWKRCVVGQHDYTIEYVVPPTFDRVVTTIIMTLEGEISRFDYLLGKECDYEVDHFYSAFEPYRPNLELPLRRSLFVKSDDRL